MLLTMKDQQRVEAMQALMDARLTVAQAAQVLGRRGRLKTVEELNWNGSVYSTTQYAYNARDQLTEINQQGQVRSFCYDGHGRLSHKKTPEEGKLTYAYNGDDTISSMTDARGAKTVYSYNGRHQVSSISYDLSGVLPGQGVASTPGVSYLYDAAGNRFYMSDGEGYTFYHYDSLARLDWEERNFTNVGTYRLTYEYNPGGALKKIVYPWQLGSVQVTYGYDKAGRVNSVGGSGYANVTSYADSITYRAFGAVKQMNFGDTKSLSTSYDRRMRATKWDVPGVLGYKYYYDDFGEHAGRVTYAQHVNPSNVGSDRTQTTSPLDRSYEYDQVGRLGIAHSGAEAKAHAINGPWGIMDGPFSQGYDYDVWGNVTHRYGWGGEVMGGTSTDIYYTYATGTNGVVNNRRNGFTYDNAGNLKSDGAQNLGYDAAGRQVSSDWAGLQSGYDGDGRRVRRSEAGANEVRYLRSSVLGGQVIAELKYVNVNGSWQWSWQRGYVYGVSGLLAIQQGGQQPGGAVYFVHEDPVTKGKRVTNTSGVVQSATELDPYGAEVTPFSNNPAFQSRKFTTYERDPNGADDAMFRRYNRQHSRFDQPDPYGGSYNLGDPQSLNRYAYVQGDPVNFVDPTGLCIDSPLNMGEGGWRWIPILCRDDGFVEPPQEPGPAIDVPGTRGVLERILRNNGCGTFVQNLINQVAESTNNPFHADYVPDLFDAVANGGGFIRGGDADKHNIGGTVSGSITGGDAGIHIASRFLYGGNPTEAEKAVVRNHLDAFVILHELVHHAGVNGYYSDRQLAEAIFKMTGTPGLPVRSDYASEWAYIKANSAYWNNILRSVCKDVK